MNKQHESMLKRVAREIREEAAHQLRGFPKDDLRRQLIGGWGREFGHQLFGTPRRSPRYHRSRSGVESDWLAPDAAPDGGLGTGLEPLPAMVVLPRFCGQRS